MALAQFCFLRDKPFEMLRRVIRVGIAEEILRRLDEFWIIREQSERRMRGGGCHGIHVAVIGEARMAVIVEDRDLAYLLQHAVVGLLVSRGHVWAGLGVKRGRA